MYATLAINESILYVIDIQLSVKHPKLMHQIISWLSFNNLNYIVAKAMFCKKHRLSGLRTTLAKIIKAEVTLYWGG